MEAEQEAPRKDKAPKDGLGPKGVPECYYTSRELDSTFRYAKFVKKLRAEEDSMRIANEHAERQKKDQRYLEVALRCDRKFLLRQVTDRIKFCLESYEADIMKKRQRLLDLLCQEEQLNIEKFVVMSQTGPKLMFEDKKARLDYLLEKRKREIEEKYAQPPLDKCVHVHPCIVKLRTKEAQSIQKYQMRENQMRKMAEREFDNMWHEMAMKEADALAQRMELDAIESFRRGEEWKKVSEQQLELLRQKREQEREMLKQEAIRLREIMEEDNRKAAEEERLKAEARIKGTDAFGVLKARRADDAARKAEADFVDDVWYQCSRNFTDEDAIKKAKQRLSERETYKCNQRMATIKNRVDAMKNDNESMILAEGQRQRDVVDLKRCQTRLALKRATYANAADNKRLAEAKEVGADVKKKKEEEREFETQILKQIDQLVKHKEMTDAQARRLHQKDLVDQMEYSRQLQEKEKLALVEEQKKYQKAADEYRAQINTMLCRPYFSDAQHPLVHAMKNLASRQYCPCSPACGTDPTKPTDKPSEDDSDKKVPK